MVVAMSSNYLAENASARAEHAEITEDADSSKFRSDISVFFVISACSADAPA
jgi:hypothetical protein